MKFRYRILYDNGESREVEASDVWIALCKSGAIVRASDVRSVQKLECWQHDPIFVSRRAMRKLDESFSFAHETGS